MRPELAAAVAETVMESWSHGNSATVAYAILADDGPVMEFFRPALAALGRHALAFGRVYCGDRAEIERRARSWLAGGGITGPLADLCLRLAQEDRP